MTRVTASRPPRRQFLKATSALIAAPFLMPTATAAQQGGFELSDDPTLTTLLQTSAGGPSPAGANTLTIRWLGCANHEIAFRDKVILLDAWYDRGPRNRALGFGPQDVTRADLIVNGHAHFDHIADIPDIARRTGASVMGAPISVGYLRTQGLPDAQLLSTAGGEHFDFDGFSVDAILAHHSILPTEVLVKLRDALSADTPPLSDVGQHRCDPCPVLVRPRRGRTVGTHTEGALVHLGHVSRHQLSVTHRPCRRSTHRLMGELLHPGAIKNRGGRRRAWRHPGRGAPRKAE